MEKGLLKKGERLDDLQLTLDNGKNAYVIQNPDWFCFGIDAVLLANFANVKPGICAVDLCTGSGIIPVLLAAKTKAAHITGIEIQSSVAEMAARTVKLNGLEDKIEIVNEDLKNYKREKQVELVTCNPPYKEAGGGLTNPEDNLMISRHEIKCTLEDVIMRASKLLNFGGSLCMVHRPERLADIFELMRKYKIEPKRIKFVQPYEDKAPNMVLIEGKRSSKPKLTVEPPVIMYNKDGSQRGFELLMV